MAVLIFGLRKTPEKYLKTIRQRRLPLPPVFDPRKAHADNLREIRKPMLPLPPDRIPWRKKAGGWWAASTLAFPVPAFVVHGEKIRKIAVDYVRTALGGDERAVSNLNSLFRHVREEATDHVLTIFDEGQRADVVFETNGTTALSLLTHLVHTSNEKATVATTDMGIAVPHTLRGHDPYSKPPTAGVFRPNVGLFSHPRAPSEYYSPQIDISRIEITTRDGRVKTDGEIVTGVQEMLGDKKNRLFVIPHVTSTGRLLPIRRIGELIKEENKTRSDPDKIYYAVDGVQAVGRLEANEFERPLDFCDFYFFSGSKGLGAPLISSAILARSDVLKRLAQNVVKSPYNRYLRHYQFPSIPEINGFLDRREEHVAVSLPELAAFSAALKAFYERGAGRTFHARRLSQSAKVTNTRARIIDGLTGIPGVSVVSGSHDYWHIPHIITIKFDDPGEAKLVKRTLQSGELGRVVTPGALAGSLLRLTIPEMAPHPKIPILLRHFRAAVEKVRKEREGANPE